MRDLGIDRIATVKGGKKPRGLLSFGFFYLWVCGEIQDLLRLWQYELVLVLPGRYGVPAGVLPTCSLLIQQQSRSSYNR